MKPARTADPAGPGTPDAPVTPGDAGDADAPGRETDPVATAGFPCPAEMVTARRPGRPRDARADEAILTAAGEVLAEHGLAGFTVDAVAARAGCAKATIYRRWRSRAELLLEIAHMAAVEMPDPDTGSLRQDLVLLMTALARKLRETSAGQLLPAVLAEAAVNPEMGHTFHHHVCERRARVRQAIERGRARGELPAGTDVDLLMDLLAGPIFLRVLMFDGPIDDDVVERVVDTVLHGAAPR